MKYTINRSMNEFESFKHGLVASKLWLCEKLEKTIETNNILKPNIVILGCWDNLLSFIMLTRKPYLYNTIYAYDKDSNSIKNANQICDTWKYESPKVFNLCRDVDNLDFAGYNNTIFINCSIDQFENVIWYKTIPQNSIVCMQTTDILDIKPKWEINQRTKDIDELLIKYPINKLYYNGQKNIKYENLEYNRLMVIGRKG